MYRLAEDAEGNPKKVHGVLTDYDLSSWTNSLNPDYTKTSQQRTGTPPYMAQDLLQGTSPLHLYRHDIESLFYVMLLVSARHSIAIPEGQKRPRLLMRGSTELPYEEWFNERHYRLLGSHKLNFFVTMQPIELSPDFEDFRPWFFGVQYWFSEGFKSRPFLHQGGLPKWATRRRAKSASTDQYDEETLGGYIEYDEILATFSDLEGELGNLVIRDPQYSTPPTSPTSA